jgi:cytoskeletal protein RodZ
MNTVGKILKEARLSKNISLSSLENLTKIKKEFIQKIEEEDWNNLPEFPVVSGFAKNIASTLELSENNLNAVLRRDYPPKKLTINPKPDIQNKFFWSPKITFGVGVAIIIIAVLAYLGVEYQKFLKPPELVVTSPKVNESVFNNKVKVSGETTTDVSLMVNNQPISLDQDGMFITEIAVTKDTKELKFVATSRSGKTTEKVININVE